MKDGDGNLVNAGGFKLMGYDLALGSTPAIVANGVTGLVPVNIGSFSLKANPSTEGNLYFNLPSNDAVVVAANLPAANAATAEYSGKTSLVTYDLLGNEVTLDIYAAKSAAGAWQISVFDKANAAANGGFPYSAAAITSATLTFDSSGQLTTSSPTELSFTIPNGAAFTLDLSKSVQLATEYSVLSAAVNGNAPGSVQSVDIDDDGTLYAVFDNGQRLQAYKIPLANVPSPDKLKPEPGNVYSLGVELRRHADRFRRRWRIREHQLGRARAIDGRPGHRAHDHDRIATRVHGQLEGLPDRRRPDGRAGQPQALTRPLSSRSVRAQTRARARVCASRFAPRRMLPFPIRRQPAKMHAAQPLEGQAAA